MRLAGQGGRYIPGGSDELTGVVESFINNPLTSDPVRFARNTAILEEDPTLGIGSPTVAWADTAFRAMHGFRASNYPSEIRQPILMLAASNDTVVSTAAIEEFAYHLRAGSHLVIAGCQARNPAGAGPLSRAILGGVRCVRAGHAAVRVKSIHTSLTAYSVFRYSIRS